MDRLSTALGVYFCPHCGYRLESYYVDLEKPTWYIACRYGQHQLREGINGAKRNKVKIALTYNQVRKI